MTRLMARHAAALVFMFGTAGVLVYANGPNEVPKTLAGETKDLEAPDGCPAEYPVVVIVKPGNTQDLNGDGIVCYNPKSGETVDNGESEPTFNGTRHVSGHGNFFDGGEEEGQDISFSFHGIGINGDGGQAKGTFEYHDQTGGGPDLRVHGDVLCLTVNDNVATLVGIVTRSNDGGLPVDKLVIWRTVDNGEGANAMADTVTRLSPVNQKLVEGCKFKLIKFNDVDIITGNIQVDEEETSGGVPKMLEEKAIDDKSSDSWGVSGHGNFFDGGKSAVQDISFSFHAIGTLADGKLVDDVAKGQFESHDQSRDLNVHGEVLCASVKGNSVTLIGIVTRSNDRGLLVDTIVGWSAEDNGEGAAGPDRVSRIVPISGKPKAGPCSATVPTINLRDVLNGNIQVR